MNRKALIDHLVAKGMLESSDVKITPLSGGVSCEILLLDNGANRFVLKRALPKLKVKADWFADVNRNHTEQDYIKYVSNFLPQAVPKILYSDLKYHFFCMEMLDKGLTNWKELLLQGKLDKKYAKKAGKILGTIHSRSIGDKNVEKEFDTLATFQELRIEPYLIHTGMKHPDLSIYFDQEAERLASVKQCLVHGDFSPKNMLVGPGRFVVLDCEVAWYGDPVFDVAFLLNHLLLKALNLPAKAKEFIGLSRVALAGYKQNAGAIFNAQFESKLVRLLKMLMLARVDGKSPVEYLNAKQQQQVRDFVRTELSKSTSYEYLVNKWLKTIQHHFFKDKL